MFHKSRCWCVAPVESAEILAQKLTEQTWTLCTGFELDGYLFLNDSTSEDGAQEYGVLRREGDTFVQLESVTFGWMPREKALEFIQRLVAGKVEVMFGEVAVKLETPEEHGRCCFCQ